MNPFYYDEDLNKYNQHSDAVKSKRKCWLYYGDDFYKTINWKTEPPLSLDTLYKLRAEEIRDSYEHVILCLSGGIDSRTILETFYRNNIHLDEIVCVGAFSQDQFTGSAENNNDEIYYNVRGLLNEIDLPNTKKRFIDYSELFTDINNFSLLKEYGNEWAINTGCWKSIHNFFWRDIKKHIANHNKKTCFIMGSGKTRLEVNPTPHIRFSEDDIMSYCFTYENGNLTRENFYFGITNIGAEIVKKQAFIMYDLYERMQNKGIFFGNYIDLYNNTIYNYSLLNIPTRKSKTKLLSIRDKYIKRKRGSDLYKIYVEGIIKLNKEIGLKYEPFYTRPYNIF